MLAISVPELAAREGIETQLVGSSETQVRGMDSGRAQPEFLLHPPPKKLAGGGGHRAPRARVRSSKQRLRLRRSARPKPKQGARKKSYVLV